MEPSEPCTPTMAYGLVILFILVWMGAWAGVPILYDEIRRWLAEKNTPKDEAP